MCLLNLLGWYVLIQLRRFQVSNSVIHPLYMVLCAHHPKSSLFSSLSPCSLELQQMSPEHLSGLQPCARRRHTLWVNAHRQIQSWLEFPNCTFIPSLFNSKMFSCLLCTLVPFPGLGEVRMFIENRHYCSCHHHWLISLKAFVCPLCHCGEVGKRDFLSLGG